MTVASFDISLSSTGVVIFDDAGKMLDSFSIDTRDVKSYPKKLRKIEVSLRKIKKNYKPSVVVMEESFTRFNKSTQAIYRARALVEVVFHNVEQVCYHATKVRKIVLGKGNATKEEVYDFVVDKYSRRFYDLDQTDSFVTGLCYFIERGVLKPNA